MRRFEKSNKFRRLVLKCMILCFTLLSIVKVWPNFSRLKCYFFILVSDKTKQLKQDVDMGHANIYDPHYMSHEGSEMSTLGLCPRVTFQLWDMNIILRFSLAIMLHLYNVAL